MISTPPPASATAKSWNSVRFSGPSRWWIASEETMVRRLREGAPVPTGEVERGDCQPVRLIVASRSRPLAHLRRAVEREHPAGREAFQQRAAQQPLAGAQLDQERAIGRGRDQIGDDADLPLAVRHEVAAVVQERAGVTLVPGCRPSSIVRCRHLLPHFCC